MSIAQNQSGAVERRSKLLEEKNESLQKEMESWSIPYKPEVDSNLQFVASGRGIPNPSMIVPPPAIAMPLVSMLVTSGPQINPTFVGGPTLRPTPFGGLEGSRHVSFGYVFDALSGQGGNNGNGGTVGSRTIQVPQGGPPTFNLGIKPKDRHVLH